MTRLLTRVRFGLAALGYVALASKLFVPAGYMPEAFGDGGPLRLCHTGLPAAWLETATVHGADHRRQDYGHQDLGDQEPFEHDSEELVYENCSLGALAGAAVLVGDLELRIESYPLDFEPFAASVWFSVRHVAGYRSRAPPHFEPST